MMKAEPPNLFLKIQTRSGKLPVLHLEATTAISHTPGSVSVHTRLEVICDQTSVESMNYRPSSKPNNHSMTELLCDDGFCKGDCLLGFFEVLSSAHLPLYLIAIPFRPGLPTASSGIILKISERKE